MLLRRSELQFTLLALTQEGTQEGNGVKGSDIERPPQEAGAFSPGVR
jgi:hypothetical protein